MSFIHGNSITDQAAAHNLGSEQRLRPTLHSDFNNARDRVGEWKAFVYTHRNQIIESLAPLMRPDKYPKNPVSFRYQLIIGRSAGKNNSAERKAYFAQIQKNSDMRLLHMII